MSYPIPSGFTDLRAQKIDYIITTLDWCLYDNPDTREREMWLRKAGEDAFRLHATFAKSDLKLRALDISPYTPLLYNRSVGYAALNGEFDPGTSTEGWSTTTTTAEGRTSKQFEVRAGRFKPQR